MFIILLRAVASRYRTSFALRKHVTPECYIVYNGCVDVGLPRPLTVEVREEDAKGRATRQTPQVVCPAERIVQVGFHPREVWR
jgi:hypothetical protein